MSRILVDSSPVHPALAKVGVQSGPKMSGETTHTGRRRGRTQREMEPPQAIPEGEHRNLTLYGYQCAQNKLMVILKNNLLPLYLPMVSHTHANRASNGMSFPVFPTALVEEEGQKEELRFVPGVEATKRVSRTSESDSRSSNNGDMAGGKDSHIPRRESVTSEELLGEAAELHPHGDEFDDLQVLDITGGLDDDLESARHVVEKGQSKGESWEGSYWSSGGPLEGEVVVCFELTFM